MHYLEQTLQSQANEGTYPFSPAAYGVANALAGLLRSKLIPPIDVSKDPRR